MVSNMGYLESITETNHKIELITLYDIQHNAIDYTQDTFDAPDCFMSLITLPCTSMFAFNSSPLVAILTTGLRTAASGFSFGFQSIFVATLYRLFKSMSFFTSSPIISWKATLIYTVYYFLYPTFAHNNK